MPNTFEDFQQRNRRQFTTPFTALAALLRGNRLGQPRTLPSALIGNEATMVDDLVDQDPLPPPANIRQRGDIELLPDFGDSGPIEPLRGPEPGARPGRVMGSGVPELAQGVEPDVPFQALRDATGNRAAMLNRYGVGGYGQVDEGMGERGSSDVFPGAGARAGTSVTIHGDPVQAEASRVRMLRDRAQQSKDINRRWLEASLGPDSRAFRDDPYRAMAAMSTGEAAFDRAPMPEPSPLMTNVERTAILRDFLDQEAAKREAGYAGAVQGARTFMDPTVTAGRSLQRSEALADARETGRMGLARALAGNEAALYDPNILSEFFGIGGGQGAGDDNVMTMQEFQDFLAETGMSEEEALANLQAAGMTLAR